MVCQLYLNKKTDKNWEWKKVIITDTEKIKVILRMHYMLFYNNKLEDLEQITKINLSKTLNNNFGGREEKGC